MNNMQSEAARQYQSSNRRQTFYKRFPRLSRLTQSPEPLDTKICRSCPSRDDGA